MQSVVTRAVEQRLCRRVVVESVGARKDRRSAARITTTAARKQPERKAADKHETEECAERRAEDRVALARVCAALAAPLLGRGAIDRALAVLARRIIVTAAGKRLRGTVRNTEAVDARAVILAATESELRGAIDDTETVAARPVIVAPACTKLRVAEWNTGAVCQ